MDKLRQTPKLGGALTDKLHNWWLRERKDGEALIAFLIRRELLPKSARGTVESMFKGYVNYPDVSHLWTDDSLARLHVGLCGFEKSVAAVASALPKNVSDAVPSAAPRVRLESLQDSSASTIIPATNSATNSATAQTGEYASLIQGGLTPAVPSASPPSPPPPQPALSSAEPSPLADLYDSVQQELAAAHDPDPSPNRRESTNFRSANQKPAAWEVSVHSLGNSYRNARFGASPAKQPTGTNAGTSSSVAVLEVRNLPVGSRLGCCLLIEKVGEGGAGVVFRALHQRLNIPVAVKVLRTEHPRKVGSLDQIRSEAQLMAQLPHPNIVRVWDFDDQGELPFLVMEYINGLTLRELITQSGALRPSKAVRLMLQVAEALAFALDKANIIHRDVKPANILLTKDGTAKLADLGLALSVEARTGLTNPPTGSSSTMKLANADMMVGTAAYMSPEQALSSAGLDHRADIYSLGVTFYQAVTGQLPFRGKTMVELMLKHAKEPPVPPRELVPELSPALSAVILSMMAKSPDERYQTYEELLGDLRELELLESPPTASPERPRTRIGSRLVPSAAGSSDGPLFAVGSHYQPGRPASNSSSGETEALAAAAEAIGKRPGSTIVPTGSSATGSSATTGSAPAPRQSNASVWARLLSPFRSSDGES